MSQKERIKGQRRRGTQNSNKPATPHSHTPTMSMLTTPKHGDSSPSYAAAMTGMAFASPSSSDTTYSTKDLQRHVQNSITEFQNKIQSTLDQLFKQMKQLEHDLNKSIEFQSCRIDELSSQVEPLAKENAELKTEVQQLKDQVQRHNDVLNTHERFSRRNNLRLVGVPANEGENCVEFVEQMLAEHFNMADAIVERAHRDGRGNAGRSPHILFKLLSYRDKLDIQKQSKSALNNVNFFIVDDLTKLDLTEKKKWSQQVKELYSSGTKLRFFAGKWRLNGQPYSFR